MVSNTKLTKDQKHAVKAFEYNVMPNDAFFADNGKVTILVIPEFNNSKMVMVSVSTMADNEKKFRPSVGKYFAMQNFYKGEYIKIFMETNMFQLMELFS